MSISVVRFLEKSSSTSSKPAWGVLFDRRIALLDVEAQSTGEFIRNGMDAARSTTRAMATVSLDDVTLLSPITSEQQFICQGANYVSHVKESGVDPEKIPFNTIFTKSPTCITGAHSDVVRPRHVQLLDYEIELGLVISRDINAATHVKANELHKYLAGLTIVNDVSARDVQLPQAQFYKGKSYRTFGPVGPCLLLLEPEEWALWPKLRMQLLVNGNERQNDLCGSMIFKPHQTLTELSGLHDLRAGDLIATGTPAGCAAKAPGKLQMFIAKHFVSDPLKWKLFTKKGLKNSLYLQPNDVMELSIRTDDGKLNLGTQRTRVVAE